MADDIQKKLANETYRTLLRAIELNEWSCTRHDDGLTITFGVSGDDLDMDFVVKVDAERQIVRLLSQLPVNFASGGKLIEGAIATSVANYSLADGSFDYDILKGNVFFRMTTGYRSSVISPEVLRYLVNCAAFTVDKFNDKFLLLSNGATSINEFIEEFDD